MSDSKIEVSRSKTTAKTSADASGSRIGERGRIVTPKGNLEWAVVSGEPTEDASGRPVFSASLVLEKEAAKILEDKIESFWQEHKPNNKPANSLGFKPHYISRGKDKNGEIIKDLTGKTSFRFKTGAFFPDGKKAEVKLRDALMNPFELGNRRIGNDTIAIVSGKMAIYDARGSTGVTLFLKAIQILKFVEYSEELGFEDQSADADAVVEDTDGLEKQDGFLGIHG